MNIVTRQETGEFRVNESLVVTVLEVCESSIKLGFALETPSVTANAPVHQLSLVRSNRRGYYRFSENGQRLFVLELTKGQRVELNDSEELVVLEVRSACVTVALCSGCECEQFRRDDSVAAPEHAFVC